MMPLQTRDFGARAVTGARRRDLRLARRIRRHGGRYALRIVRAARRAGLPVSLACALVEQESSFRNVFGHDRDRWGRCIWPCGGRVTRRKYLIYRWRRRRGHGMQGVGLTQLTWYEFQDRADRLGGCWKPRNQLRVGFAVLVSLMRRHGKRRGIARYNGRGPAARRYARRVLRRQRRWRRLLT